MGKLRVFTGYFLKEKLGEERASKVKPEQLTPQEFAELADLQSIVNFPGEDPQQLGINILGVLNVAYEGSKLSDKERIHRCMMTGVVRTPDEVEIAEGEEVIMLYTSRDGVFNLTKATIPN